jgi:hypothetical protein
MENDLISVKNWKLVGERTKVEFSMEDSKDVKLVYSYGTDERIFEGREIYIERLKVGESFQLGLMASVILVDTVMDGDKVTFSLLVPDGNIPIGKKSIAVETFGWRTIIRDSIGGPGIIEGQLQFYETVSLKGNAW